MRLRVGGGVFNDMTLFGRNEVTKTSHVRKEEANNEGMNE